jgi:hypothetical protein
VLSHRLGDPGGCLDRVGNLQRLCEHEQEISSTKLERACTNAKEQHRSAAIKDDTIYEHEPSSACLRDSSRLAP